MHTKFTVASSTSRSSTITNDTLILMKISKTRAPKNRGDFKTVRGNYFQYFKFS
eukprot:SAG11_NODE_15455_length_577_cov_2.410042_1_plen_53_part_10